MLDPVRTRVSRVPLTVRDPATPPTSATWPRLAVLGHRGDLDEPEQRPQPDVRREGPRLDHVGGQAAGEPGVLQGRLGSSVGEAVSGQHAPAGISPSTIRRPDELTHISTCFATHHLMFAEDANDTLWTSGGGPVVGWLNTSMFDETHDEARSQGWTALIMDTNGNGKRDDVRRAEPAGRSGQGQAVRRRPLRGRAAADGSVWGSVLGMPGAVVRLVPGIESPANRAGRRSMSRRSTIRANPGFTPRGMDIDRSGVGWVALASGHLASFDRRKCKGPLNGPLATGQHCPEGWTLYPEPLPQMKGVTDPAARAPATTPGSISSTRSAWAGTCRSTPATARKACSR